MNLGPVQRLPVEFNTSNSDQQVRAPQLRSSSPGSAPARSAPPPQDTPLVPSFAQDEVKVQWDGGVHLRIYQFVKQESGVLVIQVPSKEVLNVTRGIQESLQKESLQAESAQRRSASLETGSEGAKSNGS